MQELRARLAEAEETARTAERQKSQLQRQMQDFRRRLTPLHLEMQRIVEKVGWLKGGHNSFGEATEPEVELARVERPGRLMASLCLLAGPPCTGLLGGLAAPVLWTLVAGHGGSLVLTTATCAHTG